MSAFPQGNILSLRLTKAPEGQKAQAKRGVWHTCLKGPPGATPWARRAPGLSFHSAGSTAQRSGSAKSGSRRRGKAAKERLKTDMLLCPDS